MKQWTLREAREARELTQDDLAARSGITQATISRIEIGTSEQPALDTMEKLGAALDLEPVLTLNGLRFQELALEKRVRRG